MTGLQLTGQTRSNTAKLDEGIKLTRFIQVRFVRHKVRKVVVEPTTTGRMSLLFFVENPLPDDWNAQRAVIGGLAS